jgi:hypothetical protein
VHQVVDLFGVDATGGDFVVPVFEELAADAGEAAREAFVEIVEAVAQRDRAVANEVERVGVDGQVGAGFGGGEQAALDEDRGGGEAVFGDLAGVGELDEGLEGFGDLVVGGEVEAGAVLAGDARGGGAEVVGVVVEIELAVVGERGGRADAVAQDELGAIGLSGSTQAPLSSG